MAQRTRVSFVPREEDDPANGEKRERSLARTEVHDVVPLAHDALVGFLKVNGQDDVAVLADGLESGRLTDGRHVCRGELVRPGDVCRQPK